jgi:hypothetical protein
VAGRALYWDFQVWDLVNPLLIGFLGVAAIGWLIRRSGLAPRLRLSILVPFVAPLADLGENVVLMGAPAAFPDTTRVAHLLPVVTATKFAGLAGTVLLAVGLIALVIMRGPARHLWRNR